MDREPPIRILIAEDQIGGPRASAPIIAREPGFELVAKAADGESAVRSARRHNPNVVLLDLATPHLNGVAATRQILRDCPGAQIVILATDNRGDLVCDAICAGAQAFLVKDSQADVIIEAIRAVARGEARLAPEIARCLFDEIRRARLKGNDAANKVDGADEPLTERESAILQLIIEGKSNREIASRLKLAEGTVKNYVSRILEKLNARSRTELAVKALNRRSS